MSKVTCSRCSQAKPVAAFGRRSNGRRQPWWRTCQAQYAREYRSTRTKEEWDRQRRFNALAHYEFGDEFAGSRRARALLEPEPRGDHRSHPARTARAPPEDLL